LRTRKRQRFAFAVQEFRSSLSPARRQEDAQRDDKPGGEPAQQGDAVIDAIDRETADGQKRKTGRNRLGAAIQACRKPALSCFAPTINSPIRAKVGNSGRMPGTVLPRLESQTIAADTRPPTMPFQAMSIGALFGRQAFFGKRQAETLPDLHQRVGEPIDQSVIVIGRRRDP
jgi:hypothetical protein